MLKAGSWKRFEEREELHHYLFLLCILFVQAGRKQFREGRRVPKMPKHRSRDWRRYIRDSRLALPLTNED